MGPGNKKQTEQDNTNLPVSVGLYMARKCTFESPQYLAVASADTNEDC